MNSKKKILGICGRIDPSPSANTICVENVFKELTLNGYECHILATGEVSQTYRKFDIWYHVIEVPIIRYTLRRRVSNIFRLSDLPQTEADITEIKLRYVKDLHRQNNFDVIIGICASYANIYTALEMKKYDPRVLIGGYYLDTIESLSQLKGFARRIRDYYSYRGEYRVLKELDFVVLPVPSLDIYASPKYDALREKVCFAEFPTYIPKTYMRSCSSGTRIRSIIVGTLNESFRNPKHMFEALCSVCDKRDIQFHIDVYGSNDSMLFSDLDKSKCITYTLHGRVPHSKINEAIAQADLLINISNYGILAVPSKIFEFFASHKPMLTQVSDKNDSSLKYYNKYPAGHVFYTFEDREKQLELLEHFLNSLNEINVDAQVIDDVFYANFPAYVADQFRGLIEKG